MLNELRSTNWIAASLDRQGAARRILIGVEAWIARERSTFQEIAIARVPDLGRALFLDANMQFVENDEYMYHEHLALVPLLYHPNPQRVLILGGGDGLILRRVLTDPRVERVVLVDIDAAVVRLCREHLADLHGNSFDDPRAQVVIDDARAYLAAAPDPFDLVIVDLVDPLGAEGLGLYQEVIGAARPVMAPGALLATHGESATLPFCTALYVDALLAQFFAHVELYRAVIPSFSTEWGFILAADHPAARTTAPATLLERARQLRAPLRALVPGSFPSAFDLPPFLAERRAQVRALPPGTPPAATASIAWLNW